MLHGAYQSLLEARNRDEYRGLVVRFANRLGFDLVSAVAVVVRGDGTSSFFTADNAPEAHRSALEDPRFCRIDPVMQHCKFRSTPIIWDRSTYLSAGQIDKWEMQAPFGYRTGICLALHMPAGRHFLIGVDRDQTLPRDAAEVGRMVSELQLFASYAQEAALRVLLPASDVPKPPPRLTPQKIDCLRWTMEGRTLWQVGQIMKLAESAVRFRLDSSVRKLSCLNTTQAVLKSLRLGLSR